MNAAAFHQPMHRLRVFGAALTVAGGVVAVHTAADERPGRDERLEPERLCPAILGDELTAPKFRQRARNIEDFTAGEQT